MSSSLSGEDKKRLALAQLRIVGTDATTWLLSAAIEIAYGELREKYDDL